MNRLTIPTLLTLTFFIFLNCTTLLGADAHEEYLAQSACIRKLGDLNDLLHVKIYNKSQNLAIPTPDVGHGLFTQDGATISFDNSNGYYGISGEDFIELFTDRFTLAADFQEPLIFSDLKISSLTQSVSGKDMLLTGWMAVAGTVTGESFDEAYPFRIKFRVDSETEGPECSIKSFEWGKKVENEGVKDAFRGSELHTEEFLDPERSPLVIRGLCKHFELKAITLPMELWIEEHSWEDNVRTANHWNDKDIVEHKAGASVGMAELWRALPYFRPLGSKEIPNYHRLKGDPDVDRLIVELNEKDPRVKKLVTEYVTDHPNDWDIRKIQALSIRAWHILVNEDMSAKGNYLKDIDKAAYYPASVKELDLFKVFGYARTEDYDLAQFHLRRYKGWGQHTVALYELDKLYSDIWYDYGLAMDKYNAHNESMLALYLGSIFGTNQSKLTLLSTKASKMGEPGLSTDCLERIIAIDENEGNPELWYRLALEKASNNQDPSKDIAFAQTLSQSPTVLKACAQAKYLILNNKQTEGEKIIRDATKKYKKNKDLMRVRAETSLFHKTRWKNFKKLILVSDDDRATKMFKMGFVEQNMAETKVLDLSWGTRKGYYKDAKYHYKRALGKKFDPALGNKKMAEIHLALNELKEASESFEKAIKNQERNGAVYFAQSLLNFIEDDRKNFDKNMNVVRGMKIEELGTARDRSLFEFIDTFSDLEKLVTLSNPKSKKEKAIDRTQEIDALSNSIDGTINRMFAVYTPQDSAYAGFLQAILQSVNAYNNMSYREYKEYLDVNITTEEVIERMLADSDIELYFFSKNDMIKQVSKWNKLFKERIYKEIPKRKKKSTMKYLKESKTFKDSYNYL